jgi:large subunit ribosomal protein L1
MFQSVKNLLMQREILENFKAINSAIIKAKPASSKGTYFKSLTISATMSPGVKIDALEATSLAN